MFKRKYVAVSVGCILVIIVSFFLSFNTNLIDSNMNSDLDLKNTNYFEGYDTVYSVGVSNQNSDTDLKNNQQLAVTNLSEPFNFYFRNQGKDRKMVMTVYYNYEQIDFKLNLEDDYTNQYVFDIKDGELIEETLYLDSTIEMNECMNKLMISFTSGYDTHQSDLDTYPTDEYGVTVIYDLFFTNIFNEDNGKVCVERTEPSIPTNVFQDFVSLPLIINMDYENKLQNQKLIAVPESVLQVQSNEKINLMYNISNIEFDSALIILTVGFEQTNINEKIYEVVELNQSNSVFNDSFEFVAPSEPGKYEVIAYLVHDPFKTMQSTDLSNSTVGHSQRFTLEVTD
ncbi:MAG: hypothetical protein II005_10295 [Turicibacter sp.]|nr:hypothetical protein [Turicibacter sp.]MBQ8993517.1 hypothetical protein [Turicibacter sp.]MEE0881483.1 hypothetical protein [Turicibacter sp.]